MAKRNKNRAVAERGLMNKHQRKAFRAGELRVGREQIEELLQMSRRRAPGGGFVSMPLPRAAAD